MIKKIIDYKNNKRVIFINKYNRYNVLIFSSLTFLLPCYYAYLNKIYSLSIISLLVSMISLLPKTRLYIQFPISVDAL